MALCGRLPRYSVCNARPESTGNRIRRTATVTGVLAGVAVPSEADRSDSPAGPPSGLDGRPGRRRSVHPRQSHVRDGFGLRIAS